MNNCQKCGSILSMAIIDNIPYMACKNCIKQKDTIDIIEMSQCRKCGNWISLKFDKKCYCE